MHNYAPRTGISDGIFTCDPGNPLIVSIDVSFFKFYGWYWDDCFSSSALSIKVIEADTGADISSHIDIHQDIKMRVFLDANFNHNIYLKIEHTDTTYGNNFEVKTETFNAEVTGCDCSHNVPKPPAVVLDPQRRVA